MGFVLQIEKHTIFCIKNTREQVKRHSLLFQNVNVFAYCLVLAPGEGENKFHWFIQSNQSNADIRLSLRALRRHKTNKEGIQNQSPIYLLNNTDQQFHCVFILIVKTKTKTRPAYPYKTIEKY